MCGSKEKAAAFVQTPPPFSKHQGYAASAISRLRPSSSSPKTLEPGLRRDDEAGSRPYYAATSSGIA